MNAAERIAATKAQLNALKAIMWRAGDAIMEIYNSSDVKVATKEDNSPVTQADLASHNILTEGLAYLTPDIPVVSEEDEASRSIPKTHKTYWLIDPLDGTKEFINRNGEFTCNLALIEDNEVTLGFVGVPVLNRLYVGGKTVPSSYESPNEPAQPIQHTPSNSDLVRVVASKSHLNADTQAFINSLKGQVELVQAGSSLKFIKIATGEADLYPRLAPTCEWDTAAAQAVLEGVRGSVLQTDGSPMCYGKADILNPHFIARGPA